MDQLKKVKNNLRTEIFESRFSVDTMRIGWHGKRAGIVRNKQQGCS